MSLECLKFYIQILSAYLLNTTRKHTHTHTHTHARTHAHTHTHTHTMYLACQQYGFFEFILTDGTCCSTLPQVLCCWLATKTLPDHNTILASYQRVKTCHSCSFFFKWHPRERKSGVYVLCRGVGGGICGYVLNGEGNRALASRALTV